MDVEILPAESCHFPQRMRGFSCECVMKRKLSDCCLNLCAKNQFKVSRLLGVSGGVLMDFNTKLAMPNMDWEEQSASCKPEWQCCWMFVVGLLDVCASP